MTMKILDWPLKTAALVSLAMNLWSADAVQSKPVQTSESGKEAIEAVNALGGRVVRSVLEVNLNGKKQATDETLKGFHELKTLRILGLAGTKVTDEGLKELQNLKDLESLNLFHTQVSDAGLKQLKGLTKLRKLRLEYTNVTDEGLKELKGLKHLRELRLGDTKVTNAGLKELGDFKDLLILGLAGTQVTDEGLKDLGSLQSLIHLNLQRTKVTDAGLKELEALKNLRGVFVQSTAVTNKGVLNLKKVLEKAMILNINSTADPTPEQPNLSVVRGSFRQQGALYPHDVVSAVIDGNPMTIVYGRPSSENPLNGEIRQVWGRLVPYGQPWCAGADDATLFCTGLPIVIGETTIPAGAYTLYMMPEKDRPSKLIISKYIGQRGTPVDRNHDLAKIELKKTALDGEVDPFTIAIDKTETGGVLKLTWEKTQFSAPFTVVKKQ